MSQPRQGTEQLLRALQQAEQCVSQRPAALRVGQKSERPSRGEGPSLTPTWENGTHRIAVGVADTAGELGARRSARTPGTSARRRHRALLRLGLAPPPGGPKLEVLGS